MRFASEVEPVAPGICLWRFYDPSVKAELFSTALETAFGTFLIDPIPLAPDAIANLERGAKIVGIFVTNENHERAAAQFSERFQVPIHTGASLASATQLPAVVSVHDNPLPAGLTAVDIAGGPAGESAIYLPAIEGTMVIGDALINFDPYRFALLPAKYCSNFKLMRRSLSTLLDYSFERMLFAHGLPILSRARERLERLLKEQS